MIYETLFFFIYSFHIHNTLKVLKTWQPRTSNTNASSLLSLLPKPTEDMKFTIKEVIMYPFMALTYAGTSDLINFQTCFAISCTMRTVSMAIWKLAFIYNCVNREFAIYTLDDTTFQCSMVGFRVWISHSGRAILKWVSRFLVKRKSEEIVLSERFSNNNIYYIVYYRPYLWF